MTLYVDVLARKDAEQLGVKEDGFIPDERHLDQYQYWTEDYGTVSIILREN